MAAGLPALTLLRFPPIPSLSASGPVATTFNDENLQRKYGGRLTALSNAAEALLARRTTGNR